MLRDAGFLICFLLHSFSRQRLRSQSDHVTHVARDSADDRLLSAAAEEELSIANFSFSLTPDNHWLNNTRLVKQNRFKIY